MEKFGYYAISATDTDTGKKFICFTWRGFPSAGIKEAKAAALEFGRNCDDFMAEFLGKELN